MDNIEPKLAELSDTDEKMVETIEEEKNSENNHISTESEQDLDSGRDNRGRFSAGNSFSKGRPKKEQTLVEKFRSNPKALDLLQNIFELESVISRKYVYSSKMICLAPLPRMFMKSILL